MQAERIGVRDWKRLQIAGGSPMPAPLVFRSDATSRPRVRPGELPTAIGVLLDGEPLPVGIAHGAGWIGSAEEGTLEQAWRLVVRGEAVDGRWALRGGVFVELATGSRRCSGQGQGPGHRGGFLIGGLSISHRLATFHTDGLRRGEPRVCQDRRDVRAPPMRVVRPVGGQETDRRRSDDHAR
jgi:hypothetical protein